MTFEKHDPNQRAMKDEKIWVNLSRNIQKKTTTFKCKKGMDVNGSQKNQNGCLILPLDYYMVLA